MSTSQRSSAPPRIPVDASSSRQYEVYNIIPLDNMLADHPALRFPEVRAAVTALKTIGDLRPPPFVRWSPSYDLLDWLGLFFGFQKGNVKNQREHLVLLLANSQMRLQPPPDILDRLEPDIVRKLRKKILRNYETWCSFLGCKSNVWISERRRSESDERKELLYICLFLLIWGESANLRFMPECLCYIFHHMAMELNKILEGYVDESTGQHCLPSYTGENAFLIHVVTPLYKTVQAEADASDGGKAPHSAWRNYDDINEYFWSNRCFKHLGWPMRRDSNFFVQPKKEETTMQKLRGLMQKQKVGKTGFVEQRTFWNLFHSFDRLWILLILFLQAAILVAWEDRGAPWDVLKRKDAQVKMLSLFITWAGLRLWQALLDAGMEFNLVSRETPLQGFRMLLKILTAAVWSILFTVLYVRTWNQRNHDFRWSPEADRRLKNCLWAAAIFILPECLALVLFIVPWIRNFVEKSSLKIFHLLTWWFQSRSYVGRGLREGLVDNLLYSLFWVLLLAVKFAFSYQFQIKPMVEPTKEILKVKHIKYRWHEFFKNTNHLAVGLIWAPVILIYFMDTQIWYSIMSSIIGALVGLFDHLGEIRNIQQLRLRFQMFASAIQFNLMPEEPLFRQSGSLNVRIRDAWKRFRLRYGFGTAFKKMESNHLEAGRFALIWNEIIKTFREEDIVNNREVELLEMPLNSWNISVIQWPCLLLSNELLLSLSQARTLAEYSDRRLWRKISKYEYRRCAVIETYESVKHLLLRIVREDSEERTVIVAVFDDIESAIKFEKFTEKFKMSALPEVYSKVIALVEAIKRKPSSKELQKVVNALQNLYEIFIRDFTKEKRDVEQLRRDGLVSLSGGTTLLFGDAVDLPDADDEGFYRQLRRLHTVLTSRESMNNVPKNLEARRRIAFFSNSLFMNMPHAPQVEKMMTFSVLTPYYDEDVMYSKEQLRTENEDGVSIIFYLQKIFNDEWENFRERMAQKGVAKESELWGTHIRELRLWASYRGQTLARTVRGMMYYHKALKLLAFLDSASEMALREGFRELVATVSGQRAEAIDLSSSSFRSAGSVGSVSGGAGFSYQDHELATAMLKFTYVVACQIYGTQRSKKDPRAEDILYLMKNNEALRVAYVDQVNAGRDNAGEDVWEYYSVLVKYDPDLRREVEIYRVKLPGPLKLGEGKPENQNHAMIFTRGDAVQTIDMNQDNYFEEALKMRNLLQEFTKYYGIRKPTILGVREHVFTGSVSSLAWFMSAQEMSFVTLGQRVLATPLKVRMHYGHPDVFDRLWFISRGGISKASRVINISEDIFAGFNCTLRGGNVTHHEYIQVGKGRDVGLNQISMFEAKVASGNGEQVLSRDVYRLGHRLDFFRMLSFFYTTVGFYFNTMMIVLTVYAFLWGRVYLALSGVEESINSSSTDNKALGAILNQQFIVQLGLFTALPMIIENSLERGFLSAVWDFLTMQLQLASVFYTFSMGTRTHYFGRTILHGGAKYRATGRGFVVQHKKFAENYRLYARSHFVKAIELGILLIVYASYNASSSSTLVYILLTISSWFLVFSWIMAPFLFNPSGFDWLKTVYDYDDFMNWIWYRGGIFTKSEQSWEAWWNEENDHLRSSGLWAIVVEILLDLRFFFFQYGIVYQLGIANGSTSILVYLLSWIYVFAAFAIYMVISSAHDKYAAKQHIYYRAIQSLVISVVILAMVILFQFAHLRITDLITSLLAFVPTGWGLISIVQVFKPFLQHRTMVWHSVVSVARLYEIMFGMIIMMPMAILSWLPGFQSMQTRILFNEAFSRGLQISRILAGKKANPNI